MLLKPIQVNDTNVRSKDYLIGIEELISMIRAGRFFHKRLGLHHGLYVCPPKGTILENIIVNILNEDLGLGQIVNKLIFGWEPESHRIGADITVPSLLFPHISIKTGQILKTGRGIKSEWIREDHRIKYSSSRTTSHEKLEDKINFLKNPHCDVTFFLSPNYKYGKYYWVVMENLNFSDLEWKDKYSKKTGNHIGWVGKGGSDGIVSTSISKDLSAQVWVELHLNSKRIIHFEEICI